MNGLYWVMGPDGGWRSNSSKRHPPSQSDMEAMLASTAPPAISIAAPPVRYGFDGMRMGMTVETLRKRFPQAACSLTTEGTACLVANRPVGDRYYARDLIYRFVGDQLTGVQFRASIDSFAFVVAKFRQDFGAPSETKSDTKTLYGHTFDHVTFVWRNGRSTIMLSDPEKPGELSVSMSLDHPAASPS